MWLAVNILSVFLDRSGRRATPTRTPVSYSWNTQMDYGLKSIWIMDWSPNEYWIFQYSARLSAAVNSLVSCCVTCEAQVRVYGYFYKCSCKSCLGGLSHRYKLSASYWPIGAVSGVHVWSHFFPVLLPLPIYFFINEIFNLSCQRQLKPPSRKPRSSSWAFSTCKVNEHLTPYFLPPPWSPTWNVLHWLWNQWRFYNIYLLPFHFEWFAYELTQLNMITDVSVR